MPKTIPLDEQIVAVLTQNCTSDQAAAVLADAKHVLTDLIKRADEADIASLNPLATTTEAREIRQAASDHRFEANRMEASVTALEARVAELKNAEADAARQAKYDAAVKVRNELAADIARDYPRIVSELTMLAKRIIECDQLCKENGINESVEVPGRGLKTGFYEGLGAPIGKIRDIHLPLPANARLAWRHNSDLTGSRYEYPGLDCLPQKDTKRVTAEAA